ncbi:zeta toxin family protein|uniref:UDP-N-acetylglucosamine kinase n=1 Tax=Dendrosporobacter quercicolus TaxID=146817 RepID=A0A1G9VVR7_9FIRM|nr:zeta toxin family protein [Dendrosporobacter quercicolus]NSL47786.1 zeta toxin family protein [Dendrosporobacter quercicolus DSM 1736]SDM76348.1 Predicted ABC-type ATPase [Dendrosporobacter quercicolus]
MGEQYARLVVIAGPNGSGKSTITEKIYAANPGDLPSLYINADEIAKQYQLKALAAAEEADRLRRTAIRQGQSFAMETVMSTDAKIALLKAAKAAGYVIYFLFVTTQDPMINVERVRNRVLKGGHDVPADKIRSRYHRTMARLAEATRIVDVARIYDNSGEGPVLIAEKLPSGVLVLYPQGRLSLWTGQALRAMFGLNGYKRVMLKTTKKSNRPPSC